MPPSLQDKDGGELEAGVDLRRAVLLYELRGGSDAGAGGKMTILFLKYDTSCSGESSPCLSISLYH